MVSLENILDLFLVTVDAKSSVHEEGDVNIVSRSFLFLFSAIALCFPRIAHPYCFRFSFQPYFSHSCFLPAFPRAPVPTNFIP